jgi:4-oxalocrotonate tautomerase
MPLARIDLIRGKSEAYRQAIGEIVYQALLSIGVPEDAGLDRRASCLRAPP